MTPEELREALDVIGWPIPELCRRISLYRGRVDQMLRGQIPIPDPMADHVRTARRLMARLPPYTDPRREKRILAALLAISEPPPQPPFELD